MPSSGRSSRTLNWTSRIPWKIYESKPKPGSRTDSTPISLSVEQHTQPKIYYGGSVNYCLNMAKIRYINVDEPYFRPIKNKNGICILWTTNGGKLTTDAAVRGQTNLRYPLLIYRLVPQPNANKLITWHSDFPWPSSRPSSPRPFSGHPVDVPMYMLVLSSVYSICSNHCWMKLISSRSVIPTKSAPIRRHRFLASAHVSLSAQVRKS